MSDHWFEPVADYLGEAYLKYSFTKGTNNEVNFLVDELGLDTSTPVLDVGCGPGRHSLELARRGIPVVGIDISATFIDLANQAVSAEGLGDVARFVRMNAEDGSWRDEFAAVISLCQGAFGLSGGPDSRSVDGVEIEEPILTMMATALRSGGRLAVSAFSSYFQVRFLEDQDQFDANLGVNREQTSLLDQDRKSQEAQLWTTCFTPRELRLLARSVGLEPEAIYGVSPGRYSRRPPSVDVHEFLLIAQKP